MGLRFRKRIKILPGVFINLSKSGVSTSVKIGPINWNSRTGRQSINLPGGFSYHIDKAKGATKAELVQVAKDAGLSGYSKLNKQELIEFLQEAGVIS